MKIQKGILIIFLLVGICTVISTQSILAEDIKVNKLTPKSSVNKKDNNLKNIYSKGPDAIFIANEDLNDPDSEVQIESIRLMGEFKSKGSVPSLIKYLNSADTNRKKKKAMFALGRIRDKKATPPLLKIASALSENPSNRRSAIIALGLLGDEKAISVLEGILNDDDELLQIFAAGSLGLLGSEKGISIASKGLNSLDPSIRLHSIQALGLIGNAESLDMLDNVFIGKPSLVEKQTIQMSKFMISINRISKDSKIKSIKNKINDIDKSTALSRWCTNELHHIGGPHAKKALVEIIESHPSKQIRSHAERKLNNLKISEEIE